MGIRNESDNFVRQLAEENAQLRALLQKQADTNMPPSPPSTVGGGDCASRPMSPAESLPPVVDPLLRRPSQAREDEDTSPLRTIIELLRVQISSQSVAQDRLLDQLGELRSSYASLQAATSDVTDELVVMREKSNRLADQVETERKQRQQIEEEKAAEAEKVQTLRNKVEESRRAIMRLQDEAAARRASESRRGSAVLLGTPMGSERRGSLGGATIGSALLENRRAVLAASAPAPGSRRASLAVCESASASPGVGLGLDLCGQAPAAAAGESLSRRASLAHVAAPLSAVANGSHRRAASVSASPLVSKRDVDERLAALRHGHRSTSAATDQDRRHSSLAILNEDSDTPAPPRRVGSLSLAPRSSAGRLSLPAARRRSSLAGNGGDSARTSFGEDEASTIRKQLQALQSRLQDIESSSAPPPRRLSEYVMSNEGTPATQSRRSSVQLAQFGAFSFQTRGRNPALLDTPPSPSGGTFSPGGTRRPDTETTGAFAHQEPGPKKASTSSESSDSSEESTTSTVGTSSEAKESEEVVTAEAI